MHMSLVVSLCTWLSVLVCAQVYVYQRVDHAECAGRYPCGLLPEGACMGYGVCHEGYLLARLLV